MRQLFLTTVLVMTVLSIQTVSAATAVPFKAGDAVAWEAANQQFKAALAALKR